MVLILASSSGENETFFSVSKLSFNCLTELTPTITEVTLWSFSSHAVAI